MEINKENIESFFVELVDNDFRITAVIEDNLVRIEIRSNQVTPISGTFIKDFFRYDEIAEQVSVFVDYMKEIWGEVIVDYDFEYVFHWNGDRKEDGNESPDSDLEIFNIKIEVKKKKDGFFKRAFKRLKKFNEYEN